MDLIAKIGKANFVWLPRTERITFANDPRYDFGTAMGVVASLSHEMDFDLKSPEPVLGWVRKPSNTDHYYECTEYTQGGTPAWIWYGATR